MHRPQWAARLALVTIVVAGGTALLAAPAAADLSASASASPTATEPDPDGDADGHQLVIAARGTTVTAGGSKTAILSIRNQGPANVIGAAIDFDLHGLDAGKVNFQLVSADGCGAPAGTGLTCPSIGERSTLDVLFQLTAAKGAAPGPAGTITMVMTDSLHQGHEAHVLKFPVGVSASGADLLVWAPDQPFHEDGTIGKIKRGEDGTLSILIANQGDQTVNGVHVTTKLVKGATFKNLDGCSVAADKVTLTCDFTTLSLIPPAQDTDPDDNKWSAVVFTPGVHVAKDARSARGWPDLPGNTVEVSPLAVQSAQRNAAKAGATLPAGIAGASLAKLDIDATDNTDDFTIMLAARDNPGGGSGGGSGGGGSGGGSGGGLPITGAPAMVVAGAGVAALLAGGLLMFVTRRRKTTNG